MAMRWYAVNTLSGSEERAKKALEQRITLYALDDRFGNGDPAGRHAAANQGANQAARHVATADKGERDRIGQ